MCLHIYIYLHFFTFIYLLICLIIFTESHGNPHPEHVGSFARAQAERIRPQKGLRAGTGSTV
jgi:hypothetical protein